MSGSSAREEHSVPDMKAGPRDLVIEFVDEKGEGAAGIEYKMQGSEKETVEDETIHTGIKKAEDLSLSVTPGTVEDTSKGGTSEDLLKNVKLQFVDETGDGLKGLKFKDRSGKGDGAAGTDGEVSTDLQSADVINLQVLGMEDVGQAANALEKSKPPRIIIKLVGERGKPVAGLSYEATAGDKTKKGEVGKGGTIELDASIDNFSLVIKEQP
jgi:hypothetical protein